MSRTKKDVPAALKAEVDAFIKKCGFDFSRPVETDARLERVERDIKTRARTIARKLRAASEAINELRAGDRRIWVEQSHFADVGTIYRWQSGRAVESDLSSLQRQVLDVASRVEDSTRERLEYDWPAVPKKKSKRGRPPNVLLRWLVRRVAELSLAHGVRFTADEDGPAFEILNAALRQSGKRLRADAVIGYLRVGRKYQRSLASSR